MKRKTPRRTARRPPRLKLGTGWLPEEPDPRDLTPRHSAVLDVLERSQVGPAILGARPLPGSVDLRQWCPPVHFQGGFNTCSAHVVAALAEFFDKRAFGDALAVSRLFLYKVTKNFLQAQGNVGVYIRQTMGTLKLVGAPPEKYWPYPDPGRFDSPRTADPLLDQEPPAFCYAVATNYRAISYYRLDRQQTGTPSADQTLLASARSHIAASIPVAFGFPLYSSVLKQSRASGKLPIPAASDAQVGSHAVVAVGYDDALEIRNADSGGGTTEGAFLIQNSWGESWGEKGYGWIPYEYTSRGLARDFWTLTKADWVDTGRFQLPLEG
jgi:C1A family cysteine protease